MYFSDARGLWCDLPRWISNRVKILGATMALVNLEDFDESRPEGTVRRAIRRFDIREGHNRIDVFETYLQ